MWGALPPPPAPPAGPCRTGGVLTVAAAWASLAGPGAGRWVAPGVSSRRKPDRGLPPPVPPGTALAVVLSEAEGCCHEARPGMRAVGGAGIVIPAEAGKGAPPPLNPQGDGTRHCRAGRGCGRGDDCRFVPPDPPHSALALLTMDGAECVERQGAPGVSSRRKPERGATAPLSNPRGNGSAAIPRSFAVLRMTGTDGRGVARFWGIEAVGDAAGVCMIER